MLWSYDKKIMTKSDQLSRRFFDWPQTYRLILISVEPHQKYHGSISLFTCVDLTAGSYVYGILSGFEGNIAR